MEAQARSDSVNHYGHSRKLEEHLTVLRSKDQILVVHTVVLAKGGLK